MNEKIIFNFESSKYLGINLLGKQYTIDDYKSLINSQKFAESVQNDFSLIENWQAADKFFQEHTIFIINSFLSGRQILGIEMWLSLLERIKQIDSNNYTKIHKGTAYYHAGVYSLFSGHYEKAFQWFEYALEQDLKLQRNDTPSVWILTFDARENQPERGTEYEYTQKLVCRIQQIINEIKIYDFRFDLTADSLRGIIKSKIVNNLSSRSLRSAWASLLANFLEYEEVELFLKISPNSQEAQAIVNNFLLELTLILETVIKKSQKVSIITLKRGDIGELYKRIIAPIYNLIYNKDKCFLSNAQISKDYSKMLNEIKQAEVTEDKLAVAFTVCQRVRNASHHIFNEDFINEELFRNLALRIYYAILSVIEKLYV
jgi:hypothetical protein